MQHHSHHHSHHHTNDRADHDHDQRRVHRRGERVSTTQCDDGYTAVDIVLIVLILALLGTIVFLSLGGLRAAAAEPGCSGDARTLGAAAEAFFAQGHSAVPATGSGHDRHERTLVDFGLLRSISTLYDLDADGAVMPEGDSPC